MDKSTKELINEVKTILVYDYFGENDVKESYLNNIELAWRDFIDNQVIGDSQYICTLIDNLEGIQHFYGEIEVDYPSYEESDEYDVDVDDYIETKKENYFFEHHWITINDEIFEFSKGTLKDYIDWDDLYSIDCEDTNKYNQLY